MRWQDFPLPDGSYSDSTRPWTQQDVVNYLPTFAELSGTRSRLKLACAPGLRTFASVGTGPHRGARDVEGKLFVVSGNKLYQVSVEGIATELGTIPGTSRVSMTHNQVAGGNQLLIGTGSNSYVWDTSDSTLTANGVPLASVDFLNQLNLGVDSQRRFWRYSGLADAKSWNTLDNESAESSPDRIVGGIVSQGEWLVFGERTIEVWQNNPTDATAFQRGTVIEKGCANANTICRLDNTVYFLGNDLIVYRFNGYTPVPVSTKAQATAFRDCDPAKAFAFTYEDRGYVIYYLSFQDGMTWGFDVTSQRSHRRESFGLSRWRLNTLVKWNGEWYGGDYSNGKLYRLEWGYAYEASDIFPRIVRSGVLHNEGNRVRVHGVRLLVETGNDESSSDPLVPLTASGDIADGIEGDSVSGAYSASGGIPQYTFAVTSGSLPPGVTLDEDGSYSGTFTEAGSYSWVVTATDSEGDTATVPDSAIVTAPVVWLAAGQNATGAAAFLGNTNLEWGAGALTGGLLDKYAFANGDSLYVSVPGNGAVAESTDAGVTWSDTGATTTVSAGGGRMAFRGAFQFLCAGVSLMGRRSTGAWSNPSASTASRANDAVVLGTSLVVASIYSFSASISDDDGSTWASGSQAYTDAIAGSPLLATNGTRIAILYNDGTANGYNTTIKYSDDGGDTWSAAAYTFPSPDASNLGAGLAWTGTRFVACTATGQVAYSDDAASWTLSASTIGDVEQLAAGGSRLLAAASDGLYYSDDDGETWATTALPDGATSIFGVAYIGDAA